MLQMPLEYLVLLLTVLSMAIVCLSVWWGVMRPPQIVLNACSSVMHKFTIKRAGKDDAVSQLEPDTKSPEGADSDKSEKSATEKELPSVEDKLAKRDSCQKRPGSPSKVDSAADLHNTSLRCMAVSQLPAAVQLSLVSKTCCAGFCT